MSAIAQQARFTRVRAMGISVHKAIPISYDLNEIGGERAKLNLMWLGIVKDFDRFGTTVCDLSSCLGPGFLQKFGLQRLG